MQNRYVGDIGDFGKYGLLNALCQPDGDGEKLSLGVVWYLVPDESHNNDGGFIQYLDQTERNLERFKRCDTKLYDKLSQIILDDDRRVQRIREDGILPANTVYYDQFLSYQLILTPEDRAAFRNEWVQGAVRETKKCDIVFVDPDNGLEVRSVKCHRCRGPKYAFYDELKPYVQQERNQSLVIYQHIAMNGTAEQQIQNRISQINKLGATEGVFALFYHRRGLRVFIVVPATRHRELLLRRANHFLEGPWGQHFSLRDEIRTKKKERIKGLAGKIEFIKGAEDPRHEDRLFGKGPRYFKGK